MNATTTIPARQRISTIGTVVLVVTRRQEAEGNLRDQDTLMSLVNHELHLLELEQALHEARRGESFQCRRL